ncbi:hypothetical protein SNOG_09630 [Parastagonospora nodorum SN15]|uniref:Uncharacterized protein n=1 Tax=Phaeosphaeria nodorum (strain SN15 / ATCC MYA-4574 / FGSC 10173) TaxID=321614 RepID=Q0UF34_PHANO|nr:hypothetical protein SNOG_09630 [Parastagonospora nodorum SN15]EAT82895.1 hypothetical protein SNOG_09630 [Parastagonospora nodorum SN15]
MAPPRAASPRLLCAPHGMPSTASLPQQQQLSSELKSLQNVTFRLSRSRNGIAYLGPTISNIPPQSVKLETGMKTLAIQSLPCLAFQASCCCCRHQECLMLQGEYRSVTVKLWLAAIALACVRDNTPAHLECHRW